MKTKEEIYNIIINSIINKIKNRNGIYSHREFVKIFYSLFNLLEFESESQLVENYLSDKNISIHYKDIILKHLTRESLEKIAFEVM